MGRQAAHVLGRRAGREQYWSSQASEVWRRLCKLAVDTIPLKDSNRGRMRTLNWAQVKDQACCPVSTLTQLTCSSDLWPKQEEGLGHCGILNFEASRCSHLPILPGFSMPFFWVGRSPLPGLPALGSAKNLTR